VILFEPHRLQLGEELADQAGVHEVLQDGWGIADDDELVELVADALGRDDLESAPHLLYERRLSRRPADVCPRRERPGT
jgi:hypothetical protein